MTLKFIGCSVAKILPLPLFGKRFQQTLTNRKPAFGVLSAKISAPRQTGCNLEGMLK